MTSNTALFLCGPSGVGKSTLARTLVKILNEGRRGPYCILDKDSMTAPLSEDLMDLLTGDRLDRDSPEHQTLVRDSEYRCVLRAARENMELGVNVVLPAPWGKELSNGSLFDPDALGFPHGSRVVVAMMELPLELRRQRIVERGDPRDGYKLGHWHAHIQSAQSLEQTTHPLLRRLDARRPPDTLALDVVQWL